MPTARRSRVFTISMPPEMAASAKFLAKQENRTMSELMREAFRAVSYTHLDVYKRQGVDGAGSEADIGVCRGGSSCGLPSRAGRRTHLHTVAEDIVSGHVAEARSPPEIDLVGRDADRDKLCRSRGRGLPQGCLVQKNPSANYYAVAQCTNNRNYASLT